VPEALAAIATALALVVLQAVREALDRRARRDGERRTRQDDRA
jgi:hypothetical protein